MENLSMVTPDEEEANVSGARLQGAVNSAEDLTLYQVLNLNLNREDLIRMEQASREASAQWNAKQFTPSQARCWREAVRLIREGSVQSYQELGAQFPRPEYEKRRGDTRESYSDHWAFTLVHKLIRRGAVSRDEVQRVIKDSSRPRRQQQTNNQ